MEVTDLWERFRLYRHRPRGIKERLFRFERSVYQDFWALKDINISLEPGDAIAIIGANGSGKSTLLKCLAGILPPDRGRVRVEGRLASLLELGAGFHGDLTGRENVYLNASFLGLGRKQINRSLEQIVEFSGIESFIDAPVRNYSSGMYVRLGFAVAVHLDPDVLLVDEILAVGDAQFQAKCFERMHDFRRRGKTLVVVTHDLDSVVNLCDRAVLLDHGELVADGTPRAIIDTYRQRVLQENIRQDPEEPLPDEPQQRWGTGGAQVAAVKLLSTDGRPADSFGPGDAAVLQMVVRFTEDVEEPVFGYIIRSDTGTEVFKTNTLWRGVATGTHRPGDEIEVRFTTHLNLLQGRYLVTTAVAHQDATQWYDWWDDCLSFHVRSSLPDQGYVHMGAEIEILDTVAGSHGTHQRPG